MVRLALLVVLAAGCLSPALDDPVAPPQGPSASDAATTAEGPPAPTGTPPGPSTAPPCTVHAVWVEPGLYRAASANASFQPRLPEAWRTLDVEMNAHPNASLTQIGMQVFPEPARHATDAFLHSYAGSGLVVTVAAAFDTAHAVSDDEVRGWASDYAGNLTALDQPALDRWADGLLANRTREPILSEGGPAVDLFQASLRLDGAQAFYDARHGAFTAGNDGGFVDGDWRWSVEWHARVWKTEGASLEVHGDDRVWAKASGEDGHAFDPYLAESLPSWKGPDQVQVRC